MTIYEQLDLTIAGLSLVVSTVVLLFLVRQIRLLSNQVKDSRQAMDFATRQAEAENVSLRQRATFEFVAGTFSNLHELYDRLPAAGSSTQAQFLASAMVRDSSEFVAVRNYLNYLEDLSVAANMQIFDASVLQRTLGGRMKRAWAAYETWISAERQVVSRAIFRDLEEFVSGFEHQPPVVPTPAEETN